MAEPDSGSHFFVTGGTLKRDAPSYVERRADSELYAALGDGKFCYVLTSRQMGKSSLMVRTAVRLREARVAVAVLDLTSFGQNLTPEQWYLGLVGRVGQQLDLEDELEAYWEAHGQAAPLQRWMGAIREVVLERIPGRVVIFIDEIDATRSLPFSTDEFFAGIREFYNRRSEDSALDRLTFCLLGVATPSDLIRDVRTTPFNIGQRIELTDFTETEAAPLIQGLGREPELGGDLLTRVLYWTGGHPYLTQRLCLAVAQDASVTSAGGVDRLCEAMFLSPGARERDDNLLFVRDRILRSRADLAALLGVYDRIRNHKSVKDDPAHPLLSILRLSGITRLREGYLYVRNRIYYRVFDREWVQSNMPIDEVQRQRAAYWRGVFRTGSVALAILLSVGAFTAWALQQRDRAEQEKARAEAMAEKWLAQKNVADAALQGEAMQAGEALAARDKAVTEKENAERLRRVAEENRHIAEQKSREASAAEAKAQDARHTAHKQIDRSLQFVRRVHQLIKPELTQEEASRGQAASGEKQVQEAQRQREVLGPIYVEVMNESIALMDDIVKLDPTHQSVKELQVTTLAVAADFHLTRRGREQDMAKRDDATKKARETAKRIQAVADRLVPDTTFARAPLFATAAYAAASRTFDILGEKKIAEEAAREGTEVARRVPAAVINDAENWDRRNLWWLSHLRFGNTFLDLGKNAEALEAYRAALASLQGAKDRNEFSARRDEATSWLNIAKTLKALAKEEKASAAAREEEARNAYNRNLGIVSKLVDEKGNPDTRGDLLRLSWSYQELGDFEKDDARKYPAAREAYQGQIKALERRDGERKDVTTFENLVVAHDRLGHGFEEDPQAGPAGKQEALRAYEKSLDNAKLLARDQPGPASDKRLAVAHGAVARALTALAQFEEAGKAWTAQIGVLSKLVDDKNNSDVRGDLLRLSWSYRELGDIERRLKRAAAAREAYQGQIKALERRDGERKDVTTRENLVVAYDRLGHSFEEDPQAGPAGKQEALRAYEKSLENSKLLARDRPGSASDERLAVAHGALARALSALAQFEEAGKAWTAQIGVLSKLVDDKNNSDVRGDLLRLSWSYQELGDIERKLKRFAAAREAYQGQIKALERRDSERKDVTTLENLVVAHNRLGHSFEEDPQTGPVGTQEALRAYEKSLENAKLLARDRPGSASDERLVVAYRAVSRGLYAASRFGEAVAPLQAEIDILLRLDPERKNVALQRELMFAHRWMGHALLEVEPDQTREAVESYERALGVAQALARDPRDEEAQRNLTGFHGSLSYALIFTRQFDRAVAEATTALTRDSSLTWIRTNLAHAHLFANRVGQAKEIYQQYRNEKLGDGRTFAAHVLTDFGVFKKKGLTHPAMAEIESMLKSGS